MRTNKIVIEVIWRPTENLQNPSMLADELTDAIDKALEDRSLEGAAFALAVRA